MLIPDNIDNFKSHGEKLIFFKFKNDSTAQDYFVLHSVFTNHHLTNVSGELDFLVLAPGLGFFAIEVKHGGVRRESGTWIFENKRGEIAKKSKGPFSQVEETKHSIRNFLLHTVSDDKKLYNRLSKILFASGVAFTSMRSDQIDFGPEAFSWQILTKEGLSLPIRKYIKTLSDGWHREYSKHAWYDVNLSRPSLDDCEEVVRILRGDFKVDYSEVNRIADNQKIIEEFTKEQFHILSFADFNDRCLIEGQAGTGKTVLALELVRRKLRNKNKVGLFCYNQKLGQKLNFSLKVVFNEEEHQFYAGTLHKYLMQNVSDFNHYSNDDFFYSEYLPMEFLIQNEHLKESDKFDIIIIDEAQDLLSVNYIEIFDWILRGGLKNGKWVMFGDFSNQAIYVNDPKKAKELLSQKSFFAKLPPLRINCRNTKKIASHNTLLTGAELPEFTGTTLTGKPIEARFPAKSKQLEVVEEIVRELIDQEVKRNQITLLSPKKFENTYLSDSEFINEQRRLGIEVTTIHSFKGLENVIIILYDFKDIHSIEVKRLLYVGISRAAQELYLVLNQDLEASYNKLVAENFVKTN